MLPEEGQVVADGLLDLGEGQEVERGELDGGGGAEVVLDGGADVVVGEGQHAAVGVLDHEDLARAQQLLRDDDGPQRVLGASARVADHVRVPQLDPERRARVDPGVHARHWRQLAALTGTGTWWGDVIPTV